MAWAVSRTGRNVGRGMEDDSILLERSIANSFVNSIQLIMAFTHDLNFF